jgi:endoglucanase
MKFKLFLLVYYFLGTSIGFTQMSSWEVVESMGRGLNIGNTLSAPTEGNWAPIIYEQYFIDVANAGFSNVRIPADFFGSRTSGITSNWSANPNTSNQYNGSIADFSVNPSYLNRVETVVDWSLNQGLYTVIDFHGAQLKSEFLDTFNASNTDVYTSPSSAKRAADLMKFKSIWIQIANRFVNHPEQLIFEVVNEPYFEVSAAEMNVP